MTQPAAVSLVVGAGGLLGRSLVAGLPGPVVPAAVRWNTPEAADDLRRAWAQTSDVADRLGLERQVCWVAGAGVTGTSAADLDAEVSTFETFLNTIDPAPALQRMTVLLASSAGGVYAGAEVRPPYDERTPPAPTSAYGRAKLRTEAVLGTFGARTGHRVVVTRIANLYGPGQNLAKPQGLISHLCRTQLTGTPMPIYVSMDTVRDYLYVTDAAAMIAELLEITRASDTTSTLKVLASGRAVTIAALVAECARVFRRRPRVVPAVSPLAKYQASDLRLRSRHVTQVDRLATTTLGAGIHATYEDLRRRIALEGARAS